MQGTRGRKKTPYLLKKRSLVGVAEREWPCSSWEFCSRTPFAFLVLHHFQAPCSSLHSLSLWVSVIFSTLGRQPLPSVTPTFLWKPHGDTEYWGWWGNDRVDVWRTEERQGAASTRDCDILDGRHFSITLPKVIICGLLRSPTLNQWNGEPEKKWPRLIELFLGKSTFSRQYRSRWPFGQSC